MSAAVHNGPSFTGINGSFLQGGLIQSANSSVRIHQGVCVMVFVPLVFKMFFLNFFLFIFWYNGHRLLKKIGPDIAYKCLSLSEFECR